MNTMRRFFAVAALAGAMPSAFAASTVDLTVTGTIVPASCTPTLSIPNISFGKRSASDLNVDRSTSLGGISSRLRVDCVAPTLYGIRAIDNRSATVGHDGFSQPYGIGLTENGEKIGAHYLQITAMTSTIDGVTPYITVGDAAGATWSASTQWVNYLENSGRLLGFTDQAGSTTGPIPIKEADFSMQTYVHIAPASGLTLTDEVALDGSATIEVVYL